MRTQLYLILILCSVCGFISAEERLSWFTKDPQIKKSTFVPDNLSEGKEENRVLPWVFHDNETSKLLQLKCIMRGYNATNNPSDYKDARWSHPGFSDSQVDTNTEPKKGKDEQGSEYRIWTIEINTTAEDAGKKWATCEFQQGDFPLSTDFQFLIFRKLSEDQNSVVYDFGEVLDEKDINQNVTDAIKRQIGEHYSRSVSSFTISEDRQKINITFDTSTNSVNATMTEGSLDLSQVFLQNLLSEIRIFIRKKILGHPNYYVFEKYRSPQNIMSSKNIMYPKNY